MRGVYFYTGIICFAIGIALQTVFSFSLAFTTLLFLLAAASALLANRAVPETKTIIFLISIVLCFVAAGALRLSVVPPVTFSTLESLVGTTTELEGVVSKEPDTRETSTHVYVKTSETTVLGYADRFTDISYGDVVVLRGELQKPTSFTTPLGRTFDYQSYLKAKGVGYVVYRAEVEATGEVAGLTLIRVLLDVKHYFMTTIESLIPEPQVGLGEGLLLGVKQALGDEYEEAFRATGIMHIVVLSGYNVMLVVTFFMFVLAFVLPFRTRLLVGVVAIAAFALLVGLSATVVRASVMASLLLLLRFTGNTYHLVRSLFLAGLVMLLINPQLLLYDVGFQLSFMATLSLLLCAERVSEWCTWLPAWGGVREFFTATVVTQVFVLPLLLFHIGEVSIVSVVVNVLVLPMVPVAMLLTFLTGLVGAVLPPVGLFIGVLASASLTYILHIATTFASLPFAAVTVPQFSLVATVGLYVFLAGGWMLVTKPTIVQTVRQRLLPVSEIDQWTIEEESGEVLTSTSPDETPVFFR